MKPPTLRLLRLTAAGCVGLLVMSTGWRGEAAAQTPPSPARVTVTQSSWDPGAVGTWSAFTVTVSNASEAPLRGELRLVPTTMPPGGPVRPPVRPGGPAASYRYPLQLEPKTVRSVPVMLTIGARPYKAEVWDRSKLVATGPPASPAGAQRPAFNLGVVSDLPNGGLVVQATSQLSMHVSPRFRSASELPREALGLEGLDAVILHGSDPASIDTAQGHALGDYVALGGSLVVAGGDIGGRIAAGVPEALLPLRPLGTATASLAPLADLVGETTTTTTTITTGQLREGRVVLAGGDGPPLIVERSFGLGRIVQLTYDPFAVYNQRTTEASPSLQALLWAAPVLRAAVPGRLGQPAQAPTAPGTLPEPVDTKAWSVVEIDARERPHISVGAPLALLAFALTMGPGIYLLLRPRRARTLVPVVVSVTVLAGAVVALAPDWALREPTFVADEISIEVAGGGLDRVDTYRHLLPSRRGRAHLGLLPGALASTGTGPQPPAVLPAALGSSAGGKGHRSPRDEDVSRGGDPAGLDLDGLIPWEGRRVRNLSLQPRAGHVEARLRLEGGRLLGTITNGGAEPVRRLRAQAADGSRAELAPDLSPGQTLAVDAAFAAAPPAPGGARPAGLDDRVLDLASDAAAAGSAPGRLALVGLAPSPPSVTSASGRAVRRHTSLRAQATTADLEGADAFVAGLGVPRPFCCGTGVVVSDIHLPPGMVGPFALSQRQPPDPVQVYSWKAATWRSLPRDTGEANLAPTEIKDSTIRVRAAPGTGTDLRAIVATGSK